LVVKSTQFRSADAEDARGIADLHAVRWGRHFRGAYSTSFLGDDVVADRRAVWSARLAATAGTHTTVAEQGGRLVGFIHVVVDDDVMWGTLVDNLHVAHDQHWRSIGIRLLARAARLVVDRAATDAMYLWVLPQNTSAQQFHRAAGATCVETAPVAPPGGKLTRLPGTPAKLRMAWRDVSTLARRFDY